MKKKIFYGWWIVAATNIICMIGYGTWLYCFGVFFKPMMNEFGWTRAMTAGAYSLRSVEGGLASPVVGWAVDKYGPRIVVFIGGIIAGLGFVLMYTIDSLLGFYLVYGVLLSIGMSAVLYVPAMTVVANWFVRQRSRALSLLAVGAGIGGFWCAPVAARLISQYGWRISFVIIGVTIWVVVLPLSLILKRRPEDVGLRPDGDPPLNDNEKKDEAEAVSTPAEELSSASGEVDWTLRQAMASRTFWILAFAFFLSALAHAMVTVHSVNALTDAGISPEKAAFLGIGLFTLLSIIGRLAFGWLGDFVDKRYLFMISYSLSGLGIFALIYAHDVPSTLLYSALFGIGFGGTIPLSPAIRGEYFGRAAFGKIQGFMAPIMMTGSMTGPLLAGFLYDFTETYKLSFMITAVLQFIAAVTIFFARPSRPPEPAETS